MCLFYYTSCTHAHTYVKIEREEGKRSRGYGFVEEHLPSLPKALSLGLLLSTEREKERGKETLISLVWICYVAHTCLDIWPPDDGTVLWGWGGPLQVSLWGLQYGPNSSPALCFLLSKIWGASATHSHCCGSSRISTHFQGHTPTVGHAPTVMDWNWAEIHSVSLKLLLAGHSDERNYWYNRGSRI